MAAQRGKDMLLKVQNDLSQFVAVAGLRSRRIAFNAQTIDATHAESAGRWRELLAGAGVKRAQVTGAGVFKDAASDAQVRLMFFDGAVKSCQIVVPDFGVIEGPFQVSSLDYRGEHQGEVVFDITLDSAGSLTFTAI
jgi:TP901-1 family phage major tail protein